MIKYSESQISSHHNYLVNGMLTPGFVVGDPHSQEGFYFLADPVLPGESTARISARLLDEKEEVLLELKWNRMVENSGGCTYSSIQGGFSVCLSSGERLLEVRTQSFTNGYLTHINAGLLEEHNGIPGREYKCP